jgi:GPI-anchor transamidase subunit T
LTNRSHLARLSTSAITPLSITRSLRGSDQTRGGFTVSITNYLDTEVHAFYVESVPWVLRPYLSSLRVDGVQSLVDSATPGSQRIIDDQTKVSLDTSSILDFDGVNYVPPSKLSTSKDTRTMPTLLEIPLSLPPRSIVRVSFEFEKVFLKYTEHPPDAQRGWDLPGGVLIPAESYLPGKLILENGKTGTGRAPRMYTAPLLADLATPDFSMPYNVIILSGALIALLFGMTFNMLMRRFILVPT